MAASISKQLIEAAQRHIFKQVPLCEMDLSSADRNRIERVKYVRFLVEKEPELDVFAKFKRIAAGRYDNTMDEWMTARKDLMLYDALQQSKSKI